MEGGIFTHIYLLYLRNTPFLYNQMNLPMRSLIHGTLIA
jgi:hypothetical protein